MTQLTQQRRQTVMRFWAGQCRALTAVACVAKTAEDKFGKYYDAFIPGIKAIVTATAPKASTDPQVRGFGILQLGWAPCLPTKATAYAVAGN